MNEKYTLYLESAQELINEGKKRKSDFEIMGEKEIQRAFDKIMDDVDPVFDNGELTKEVEQAIEDMDLHPKIEEKLRAKLIDYGKNYFPKDE